MIECPNCGVENDRSRAFCQLCGERLPQESLPPAADAPPPDDGMLEWLLKEMEPAPEDDVPPPAPVEQPPPAAGSSKEEVSQPFLPAWLQGLTIEEAPPAAPVGEWDESLDFTDLPEWDDEASAESTPAADEPAPTITTRHVALPTQPRSSSTMGSGLLSGITEPIPIEPIITVRHRAPAVPVEEEIVESEEGANLFARIAGGAALPEQEVTQIQKQRRGWLSTLLLLVAVTIPLLLGGNLLGAPAPDPNVATFAAQIDALPPQSTVLVAFDFEGPLHEDILPGALATLNHLRALDGAAQREVRAVSTMPQGVGMADMIWARSSGGDSTWQNLGYLPGSAIALRSLLDDQFSVATTSPAMIIVIAGDGQGVQRWIEQVGSYQSIPFVAITPALAEGSLAPYLASGQLDGLLAGVPAAAAYEQQRGTPGAALRRLDATSVGALLLLGALLAGTVAAPRKRP